MQGSGSPFDSRAWGGHPIPSGEPPAPPSRHESRIPKIPQLRIPHRSPRERAPRKRRILAKARPYVVGLLLGVLAVFGARTYLIDMYSIPSSSMSPTLKEGDRILVEKVTTRFGNIGAGDVVVFDGAHSFDRDAKEALTYVKRVIAVEGDVVRCCDKSGRVLVNGVPLPETYLHDRDDNTIFKQRTIRPGHVFVLGDNRGDSEDSRIRGSVPVEDIIGVVTARGWPLGRLGLVN